MNRKTTGHIIRFLAALLIAAGLFAIPAFAEGSVSITTPEGLLAIANDPDGSYRLNADIDMSGTLWTPFAFSGSFDGQGYAIRNLTVRTLTEETRETVDGNTKPYDTTFAGLFGILENAEVKNLELLGVSVEAAAQEPSGDNTKGAFIGGIAGYAGDSVIENCRVTGTLSLKTNAKSNGVGGVVGFAKATDLRSVTANTTLILTDTDRSVRDENFLGGAYAAGYGSVTDSVIGLDAYDSCHGYVHSGGLVGMYYPFGYAYDAAPLSHFDRDTVHGTIHFFEENPSRRAYCEATIGEIMNWTITRDGNDTAGFVRDETKAYDTDLLPSNTGRTVEPAYTTFREYPAGTQLTFRGDGSPLVGVYAVFREAPGDYTFRASSAKPDGSKSEASVTIPAAEDAFLQRYIDFGDLAKACGDVYEATVTLTRAEKVCGFYPVTANDLAANGGKLPAWVHDWDDPCEAADVALLSGHADDEQLFFAGILPYYAQVKKLDVQVIYLTDHLNEPARHQERLNGLWTVGIRHYPVSIGVPDAWSETYDQALSNAKAAGWTEEYLIEAVRTKLCRFQPKVVVCHDEKGEYSHGQHILYTGVLEQALSGTDSRWDGTWAESMEWLERVYLHLYETDPVTLSFLDTPFDELGGKTPFQVTQDGFRAHQSQMWTWFKGWIYGKSSPITAASQIATYSPLSYGLFYDRMTAVSGDPSGAAKAAEAGDFFAGLTTYAEERAEAERIEAERLALEAQQEAERRAAEEREAAAQAKKDRTHKTIRLIAFGVILLLAVFVTVSRFMGFGTRTRRKGKYRAKH